MFPIDTAPRVTETPRHMIRSGIPPARGPCTLYMDVKLGAEITLELTRDSLTLSSLEAPLSASEPERADKVAAC